MALFASNPPTSRGADVSLPPAIHRKFELHFQSCPSWKTSGHGHRRPEVAVKPTKHETLRLGQGRKAERMSVSSISISTKRASEAKKDEELKEWGWDVEKGNESLST